MTRPLSALAALWDQLAPGTACLLHVCGTCGHPVGRLTPGQSRAIRSGGEAACARRGCTGSLRRDDLWMSGEVGR